MTGTTDAFYEGDITQISTITMFCCDLSLWNGTRLVWQLVPSTDWSHSCSCTVLLPHGMSPGVRQITGRMGWIEKAQTPLWVTLGECDETALWLLLWAHNSIHTWIHRHTRRPRRIFKLWHLWVRYICLHPQCTFLSKVKIKVLTQFRTHVLNNWCGGTVWGSHLPVKYKRPVCTLSQLASDTWSCMYMSRPNENRWTESDEEDSTCLGSRHICYTDTPRKD